MVLHVVLVELTLQLVLIQLTEPLVWMDIINHLIHVLNVIHHQELVHQKLHSNLV